MMIYDRPSDYESNYLNNQIQAALNACVECGSGGLLGDLNWDGGYIVLDIVALVNIILEG